VEDLARLRTWGLANASKPRWNPAGTHLAFLAARGDEKEIRKGPQVWLLDRGGGNGRDAGRILRVRGLPVVADSRMRIREKAIAKKTDFPEYLELEPSGEEACTVKAILDTLK
jgi:hypothetical protein